MEAELELEIILLSPTPDVCFGLQKGSGAHYETVQKQMSKSANLSFKFTIKTRGDQIKDATPKFFGDFVQGPSNGKFIYIDIGTYAGETNSIWGRRLKIPLVGITWQTINELTVNPKLILEAQVKGTGKDGSPNCATVKPFDGWRLKS